MRNLFFLFMCAFIFTFFFFFFFFNEVNYTQINDAAKVEFHAH